MSPALRVVRRVLNEIHGIQSGSMRRHAIIQPTLQEEQPLHQIEQLFMCGKSFMWLVNNTEAKITYVFAVLDQKGVIRKCNPEYGIPEQKYNMKLTAIACSKLKIEASVKSHIK